MAAIPVRLPPLPGEALDSWLEAYAHLLHVTVRDIFDFTGIDWDRVNGDQRADKPWLCQLDEPDLAALSSATGVPPRTLADMTLARYQSTGLAEVTAPPGMRRTPRWWRQLSGSRYCPRCLATNGGRWMLAWRIPWTFACTSCQVLLADTCPDCGRRHRRTRTGRPREPGRCDLTSLPLPPWHPPRGTAFSCISDPAGTPAAALPAGGYVLSAQQRVDALIAALLASRGQPAETAALQQYLDDACAVARAAVSAVNGTAEPPAAAIAVLEELGARTGPGAAASMLASRSGRPRRQLAPVTAFGVTIADIMLHGRPTTLTPSSPRGSLATPPAAATPPAQRTSSPTGTRLAPPSKPPWPSRWRPASTLSTSCATAPSPARPASLTPPAPGNARRPCRR
jgi:TniQ protein